MSDRTPPRVPAYPDTRGGLRTWCCWCNKWHYHGPKYGHRSAHCHRADSPFRDTGYILTDPAALEREAHT